MLFFAIGCTILFLFLSAAFASGVAEAAKSKKGAVAVFLVLGLLSFWPIALAGHIVRSSSARYRAEVVRVHPLSSLQVRVYFVVTNVGTAAGQPFCTINVQAKDRSGNLLGSGIDAIGGGASLMPGKSLSGYDDVIITDNVARQVRSRSDVQISSC